MRVANLYYKDILLGTLYEDGRFDYKVCSNYANEMNVEHVIHTLETMRQVGLSDTFVFDEYVKGWLNFPFKDNYKLEIE